MYQRSIALLSVFIAGCAAPYASSIPQDYRGRTAMLRDSVDIESTSKADFFVAEQVNGVSINNSLVATQQSNQGRGMSMAPVFTSRQLVAGKPITVLIKARTHYAAPIQALTRTVYEVKGAVVFTPKDDGNYTVKGTLGESYSAVWIEDDSTKEAVAKKVEVNGSAKLGVLQK